MARNLISQPNGKLAIWSTVTDSVVNWNCTPGKAMDTLLEFREDGRSIMIVAERIGKQLNGSVEMEWAELISILRTQSNTHILGQFYALGLITKEETEPIKAETVGIVADDGTVIRISISPFVREQMLKHLGLVDQAK